MQKDRLKHYGMCDASAAIALPGNRFAVANDEDNFIKIYDSMTSGKYTDILDIGAYFGHGKNEADIEGVSEIDGTLFWITSHGRNRKGRRENSRYYFFANKIWAEEENFYHSQAGIAYNHLLEDILSDKKLDKYDLEKASKRPPKAKGGLNIEGLSATPDGQLMIGFRSPLHDDKGLLLPLENPFDVIAGQKAVFGDMIEIDLGGLGIRSIEYWPARSCYVIVAGPHHSGDDFRLYTWTGGINDAPEEIQDVDWEGLNPEGIILYPDNDQEIQIVSDDGNESRGDCKCKRIKDDHDPRKYFRSLWVSL